MNRREFLTSMATKAAGGAVIGLAAGCTFGATPAAQEIQQAAAQDAALPELKWQMATSWPVALDTIFGGAQTFVEAVKALTGGRFVIEPRAAGELAPGTQVLDVVSQGAVPIGHTASYYYVGKSPAVAFGTTVPFGLTAQQQNAWFYEGGGLAILQELYQEKFNVIQFPAGNTGAQMGGWFRKEINTPADLNGLKMRIPGLGGQVMAKLGVTVQVLPGGEIFQALQTGAIDAAEWVGPYDDEKLGLNKAAEFYYYPGWWEPGPALEVEINLDEWKKLPELYQAAIQYAAYVANMTMLASYDARNGAALQRLVEGGTKLRPYSEEILVAAKAAADELYEEFSAADADFARIYKEWDAFRKSVQGWHDINEYSMMNFVHGTLG
ncbi:TRAP transporter substrate-binding protein [Caldilinea sp.]|jgi:TRAP-type mannitol/chloroaromatic compound transport system substrate-binding protein|uniref:TRAP transporter substrate-binding protein n=1 Tax=Caldilinea sp. TaxID=2293560 RepID=UPI002580520F|nr:TRAP transporter substrate-binding protein [Caldilinea sp.]